MESRQISAAIWSLCLQKKGVKYYLLKFFTNLWFYFEDKYAAETRTMTKKKDERRLSIFDKKILAEYTVQYAREGSGGRDTTEN